MADDDLLARADVEVSYNLVRDLAAALREARDEVQRYQVLTVGQGFGHDKVVVERLTAELETARAVIRPFVDYYRASMASRNPKMGDDIAVASVHNNVEGDTTIAIGHLRAAERFLASVSDTPTEAPEETT